MLTDNESLALREALHTKLLECANELILLGHELLDNGPEVEASVFNEAADVLREACQVYAVHQTIQAIDDVGAELVTDSLLE